VAFISSVDESHFKQAGVEKKNKPEVSKITRVAKRVSRRIACKQRKKRS